MASGMDITAINKKYWCKVRRVVMLQKFVRVAGVLSAAILCILIAVPTVNAIPMYEAILVPSAQEITLGSDFFIDVFFDGLVGDGVLAFGFDVDPVPAGISYNGADVAVPFFDDSGFFLDTDVAGSYFGPDFLAPTGDNIPLASLKYTANQEGIFTLGISSDFPEDLNEGLRTINFNMYDLNGSVDVTVTATSVPDADVALLILTGIGILGILERKRFHNRIRF
jgi:hypothetical protein